MRTPIRHIVDNLVWTVHGTVWAIWRVTPVPVAHTSLRQRDELLTWTTNLVRHLAGSARIYGLCAQQDAGQIVARMVDGVDLHERPAWAEVCLATLDLLEGLELAERTHWLAVPLEAPSSRLGLTTAGLSALTELSDVLGITPPPVGAAEVDSYRQRAAQVATRIGTGLDLTAAVPAEIVWMYVHSLNRGLSEPLLAEAHHRPTGASRVVGGTLRSPSYAHLGQVRLTEGGVDTPPRFDTEAPEARSSRVPTSQQAALGCALLFVVWLITGSYVLGVLTGLSGLALHYLLGPQPPKAAGSTASVLRRRWLQVETEAGTSYQALMALAEMPSHYAFPGGDWLTQLDLMPFGVDYAIDLRIVASTKAAAATRQKMRELVDQADHYGAETSGLPGSLHEAAGDLREMQDRLRATSAEVEVQTVTALAVWGATPEECDRRAETLRSALDGQELLVVRAAGAQQQLFALMLPGTPAAPALREFTQYQLSQDWAMSGAFTSVAVGDPTGAMIGVSLDAGTVHPVLLDLADAPSKTASASMGVIGELGGGKSVLQKMTVSGIVDRGGRAIVIDRTPLREWASFARSAAGERCQIVDAAAATISIDPLRVFPDLKTGAHYAVSYLAQQLGSGPMSTGGLVIGKAVKQAAARPDRCMAVVVEELEAIASTETRLARAEEAANMADRMRVIAENPLGAMIFDPALPAVRLDGDFVVFTTDGLKLPPREVFADAELMRQQPLEAVIGRGALYLYAAIARQVAFEDPSQFTVIGLDECYWLTSSAEGRALVLELVRDGRKHKAGVILGGHDGDDIGDETIQGLLAYKVLMRHTDPALARRGLRFLGLPDDDEDLVKLVTSELSPIGQPDRAGEGMLRDPRRRVGRFQAIIPPVPRIAQAIKTSPPGSWRSGRDDRPPSGRTAAEPSPVACVIPPESPVRQPASAAPAGGGSEHVIPAESPAAEPISQDPVRAADGGGVAPSAAPQSARPAARRRRSAERKGA